MWHKNCKVGQKREQDLWLLAEELRTQRTKDEGSMTALVSGLRPFQNQR